MGTIREKIKENLVTLIITLLVTLITVFSDKILEKIKFALNRADLRVSHYENLASNISDYLFTAENVTEYYEFGWTTKSSLEVVVPAYNVAITDLRKKEYATIGLLYRFWSKEDVMRFKAIMETVRKIDFQLHSLNSEAELIVTGKKERADTLITKPVTVRLKVINKELQNNVTEFLSKLI